MSQPTLLSIFQARQRIAPIAKRTPLRSSLALFDAAGAPVHLKMEIMQNTGAFKLRGAANKILKLPNEARRLGVTTASSGNHGRAVAYVAKSFGIHAVICLSHLVPQNKVEAVRKLGAEVIVTGNSQDEATETAHAIACERGMTYIPPFDDPDIIAGQGTIGLEILEDCPEIQTLVVQVSGGGLMAGIALAAKSINPAIHVVGVTMERGAAMYESQRQGRPVEIEEVPTLADSLQGGILLDNRYSFDMCRKHVDRFLLVSEVEIAEAMAFAFYEEKLVLEGAGAAGIALLRNPAAADFPGPVATICTGNNVDSGAFLKIVGSGNYGAKT